MNVAQNPYFNPTSSRWPIDSESAMLKGPECSPDAGALYGGVDSAKRFWWLLPMVYSPYVFREEAYTSQVASLQIRHRRDRLLCQSLCRVQPWMPVLLRCLHETVLRPSGTVGNLRRCQDQWCIRSGQTVVQGAQGPCVDELRDRSLPAAGTEAEIDQGLCGGLGTARLSLTCLD